MDLDGLNYYSKQNYTSYVLKFQSIEAKAREIVPRCSIILQNNLLMCTCLVCFFTEVPQIRERLSLAQIDDWRHEQCEKKWDEITTQFASIHQKTNVYVDEDSAYDDLVPCLALAYNCLFWTWINPKGISRNNSAVLESLVLVRKCLHFVLNFFQCPCVNDSFDDVYLSVLHLMSLSSAHLLKPPGVHNKLLLEIYFIVGHIILESTQSRRDEEFLQKFTSFLKSLRKFKPLFFCHSNQINCVPNLSIFKFGLSRLNATVHASDIDLVLNGLGILECLCLLRLNQYNSSQATLENLDFKSDLSCFSGYLKAYILMLLGDDKLSLLFVQELLKHQMPEILQYHCHLLKGIVLSKTKAYDKAHREFLNAEGLNKRMLPTIIVIFHMALNYEGWLKHSPTLNTISNGYLCSLKLVTRALQQATCKPELSLSANYCSKTLKILEPTPDAVLGRALYMLARNYETSGEFKDSAKTFLKLFRIPDRSKKPQFTLKTCFEGNPPTLTVLYETITMLVKNKQFENAKIVCNIALNNAALHSAEDRLIPLMFLAIIEGKLANKPQEIKFLRKCLSVALAAHSMEDQTSVESSSTLNKLVARVYLQKALYYVNIRHFNAATVNFKMALGANILDKKALYQYLRFLIKSRDMNRFELWISHKLTLSKKEECYSNLALQYLLESNITDVKIETISAHFWASEVFNDF